MNPEADGHTANIIREIAPDISSELDLSSNPPLVHVWYCKKCRDTSFGSICNRCQEAAVRTEGTIYQYKQVEQALLDNRNEWRDMLERMVME